jgi:DNA polymerase/3'-5' exonuclease PolX
MRIEEARRKAEEFVQRIQSQCERLEIVGSIRRGKAQVNDIDLLAIPKDHRRFLCGMQAKVRGPQIIRFEVKGAKCLTTNRTCPLSSLCFFYKSKKAVIARFL